MFLMGPYNSLILLFKSNAVCPFDSSKLSWKVYIHIIYFPFPAPVALADRVIFEIHRWVGENSHHNKRIFITETPLHWKINWHTVLIIFPRHSIGTHCWSVLPVATCLPWLLKEKPLFCNLHPFFTGKKKTRFFFPNAIPNLKFSTPFCRWRMPAMNWWSLPWATPMWAWPMRYAGSFWRRFGSLRRELVGADGCPYGQ